ncbi:MAG: hypothetical protein AUJ98_07960 [Bacteroidetes bacterium CG2_30_33_31]|nr:MAG: hypothetical protein AUJ98_07960 [Bacteroidetes bacterium CG2_30_33_31]
MWLLSVNSISAQTYNMASINNQTISTCTGNFYDSGGPLNSYNTSENYTVTFCPGTVGGYVQLDFTTWNLGSGDNLEIFDGPNTSAVSFGVFNSSLSPVGMIIGASILNPSGCITLHWTSISSAQGWAATLHCGLPCQTFAAGLQSSIPPFTLDSGVYYIDVCKGDTISLKGRGVYLYNDSTYHQSDTTSTFQWKFSNGFIDTNQTITFIADTIKGYNIYLTIWDSNGCMSSIMPKIRLRVSTIPSFNGTTVFAHDICQNDTTTFLGVVTPKKWKANSALNHAGITYLPDGSGASYTSTLVFNQFAVGQTIQNVANIIGVCATMEHSFLGDLNIMITCPSGQSTTLKPFPGGGGTFLGEATDGNDQPIPGLGYEYCWRPTGTTTMLGAVGFYSHSFVDNLGVSYTNASYLPPSTSYPPTSTATGPFPLVNYSPQTPFTSLIGCPLNGAWTITVTDNWAIDNGYIFSWGIQFAQNVLPVAWSYTPSFTTNSWNPNTYVVNNTGNSIVIQPTDTGSYTYKYTVVDNMGCSYDTSVTIVVAPVPIVNLGSDTIICGQTILTLDAGNTPSGNTYNWSTGSTNQTQLVNMSGYWTVTVTNGNANVNCTATDSINIQQFPLATVDFGPDTCLTASSYTLDARNSTGNPPFLYLWSDGSTSQTLNVSKSGIYSVTVATDLSSPCLESDEIQVILLPDTFMGTDREFCDFEEQLISLPTEEPSVIYGYHWTYDGNPYGADLNFLVLKDLAFGDHKLALQIDGGCKQEINLKINDCKIIIPNIITPNGDGKNDALSIDGLDNFENTEIKIYNRWGKPVYESKNYHNNDWNGGNLADGVYYYILQLAKGSMQKYQGSITIMRN